jgi:hypothetical protein
MGRIARDAKVPRLHPHLLRHTSAANYLVHGADVISLQRKLGHSAPTMTHRYVHLASDQAAAQERVAPMPGGRYSGPGSGAGQALDKLDVSLIALCLPDIARECVIDVCRRQSRRRANQLLADTVFCRG